MTNLDKWILKNVMDLLFLKNVQKNTNNWTLYILDLKQEVQFMCE